MPSCNTYRLTWVSLTLDQGYLLTAAPLEYSSRPSCNHAAAAPWSLQMVIADMKLKDALLLGRKVMANLLLLLLLSRFSCVQLCAIQ